MDILTRFELRKIIRRKSFYIGILVLVAVAILLSVLLVTNIQMTGKEAKFLNGVAAIQLERVQSAACRSVNYSSNGGRCKKASRLTP